MPLGMPRKRAKVWEPRLFQPQHVQVVRLAWQGYNRQMIAQVMGISDTHVKQILRSPSGQRMLADLNSHNLTTHDEVEDEIQMAAPEALAEMVRIMHESENDGIKQKAAADILDRAGHGPVHRYAIDSRSSRLPEADMTPQQIRELLLNDLAIELKPQQAKLPGPDDVIQ